MNKILVYLTRISLIFALVISVSYRVRAEDTQLILQQLEILQKDIKTLEKAVYSQPGTGMSSSGKVSNNSNDVLTQHLLKLSDLEEQFKILTNNFEEINFKLDKLSSRITKVQTDNQMRFQDLEKTGLGNISSGIKKLPGSGEAQDLGTVLAIPKIDTSSPELVQRTQSIESAGTVITETAERTEKILPETSPEERYKFAISFLKVGDYETAEFALREFVETHPRHELAGSAQFWYGETFRIRQLYQDAATAYLDGYQKYPKSSKAPRNLLELGVMMVQIGEKEQGCSMILGVEKEYPTAKTVIQKAEYNKKKFGCEKKS